MMYARALANVQSSVSALQYHALRDARHRAEMAELEALVAEHEALAEDVGPAAAVSPQSPKA